MLLQQNHLLVIVNNQNPGHRFLSFSFPLLSKAKDLPTRGKK